MLSKCCLLLAANESFQKAEEDLKVMTGLEVGHSTHHRHVQKADVSAPNLKQKLTEVSLDGGKVRLRSEKKGESSNVILALCLLEWSTCYYLVEKS